MERESTYRNLVENAVEGMFRTAVDGSILFANPATARIVGFDSPEELISSVPDIRGLYVDPSRRDAFAYEVQRNDAVSGFEYQMRRKDGSVVWVSVSARAIRDEAGELTGYEGVVLDVTRPRLVEAAMSAIASNLDPTKAITSFADVLKQVVPFFQLTLAVIEGDRYRRLISYGAQQQRFAQGALVPLAGNSMESVVRTRAPVVVEDTRASPYPFDETLARAGLASYVITPLIKADEVFGTFNLGFERPGVPDDRMVDLVSSVTTAVSQGVNNIVVHEQQRSAMERLQELDRLKDDFVAMVAHDLRSPMTVIVGFTDLLQRKLASVDAESLELLDKISQHTKKLARFVEDILEVALIESGELSYNLRPFDLAVLAERTITDLTSAANGSRFKLELAPDLPLAFGDEQRHWQVLMNLISNATKFSDPDTPIEVAISAHDGFLELSVRDYGIGIAPEHVGRVFQKFSRLEDERLGKSVKGSGLGLYMCKSMVEAQGGQIWVESTLNEGSTFRYTLPAAKPHLVEGLAG